MVHKKECRNCNKKFEAKQRNAEYCSDYCRVDYNRKKNKGKAPTKKTTVKKAAVPSRPTPPPTRPVMKGSLKKPAAVATPKAKLTIQEPKPSLGKQVANLEKTVIQANIDRLQKEIDNPPIGLDIYKKADWKNVRKKQVSELKEQLLKAN